MAVFKHRTNMKDFVLDILDYMEEKLNESAESPHSRLAALTEMRGAVPVMLDRLRREDEDLLGLFGLLSFGKLDFLDPIAASKLREAEFTSELNKWKERFEAARSILENWK